MVSKRDRLAAAAEQASARLLPDEPVVLGESSVPVPTQAAGSAAARPVQASGPVGPLPPDRDQPERTQATAPGRGLDTPELRLVAATSAAVPTDEPGRAAGPAGPEDESRAGGSAAAWSAPEAEWQGLTLRYARHNVPPSRRLSVQFPPSVHNRVNMLDRNMALDPRRGRLVRNRLYTLAVEELRPTAATWRRMKELTQERERAASSPAMLPCALYDRLTELSFRHDPPVPLAHVLAAAVWDYLDRIEAPKP